MKKKFLLILFIILLIILLLFGGFFIGYKSGKFDSILNMIGISTKKKTIQETKEVEVKSNDVYITDVSGVIDEVMPSIVAITSKTIISSDSFLPSIFGEQYQSEGAGSGVIVSDDNDNIYILTNYHVVGDTSELSVKFFDDKSYDATIKGVSEKIDIAIVSVSKKNIGNDTLEIIRHAKIGNSDDLKVGNGIIAIGNALGYGQSVTTGVVSALNREVSTDDYIQDMIQIDAAINGGNSGGALINSKGELVGINSLKYSNGGSSNSASIEGMGFAIPISSINKIMDKLIQGKNDDSKVSLGIEGYMTNSQSLSNYNLPVGFYISKINTGSNAEKAELSIGNIIVKADDVEIKSVDSLQKVLNKKNNGDSIKLLVKYVEGREYREREVEVVFN